MIAVVARQEDLLLISADAAFDSLGVERLWG
jgi:PIN domain nuclease of toxin-antitoxin system